MKDEHGVEYGSSRWHAFQNAQHIELMKRISHLDYELKRIQLEFDSDTAAARREREEFLLRESNPAVKEAYDAYQILLQLAREGK